MIAERLLSLRHGNARVLVVSAVFFGLAFFLNQWQNQLEADVMQLAREYRIDTDLSARKTEHLAAYQALLGDAKLPAEKLFRQNEWLQFAQGLASGGGLSLKELKPVYRLRKKGGKVADMFLVLEGPVPELVRFLYSVAQSDDLVYVEKMLIDRSDEESALIRAQITLAQAEGTGRNV